MKNTKAEATKTKQTVQQQTLKTSDALFEAMCALEEKQARVRKGIDTCRENHRLGAKPGEGYQRALETHRLLGEAHAEIDRLRVEADLRHLAIEHDEDYEQADWHGYEHFEAERDAVDENVEP